MSLLIAYKFLISQVVEFYSQPNKKLFNKFFKLFKLKVLEIFSVLVN